MSITDRRSSRILISALLAAALSVAAPATSSASRRLGNGPPLTSGGPIRGTLPRNQALIVVIVSKGKVLSVTGTAVPKGKRKGSGRRLSTSTVANCTVNFTHSTKHSGGKTTARWFGGVGCDRSMFLFGEAYLQESSTTIDADGGHYQKMGTSALSGRSSTVINSPHPSLYIRHLVNVFFPKASDSGKIIVKPAAGQVLNAASKCEAIEEPGQGAGVHCDLYTNRFT